MPGTRPDKAEPEPEPDSSQQARQDNAGRRIESLPCPPAAPCCPLRWLAWSPQLGQGRWGQLAGCHLRAGTEWQMWMSGSCGSFWPLPGGSWSGPSGSKLQGETKRLVLLGATSSTSGTGQTQQISASWLSRLTLAGCPAMLFFSSLPACLPARFVVGRACPRTNQLDQKRNKKSRRDIAHVMRSRQGHRLNCSIYPRKDSHQVARTHSAHAHRQDKTRHRHFHLQSHPLLLLVGRVESDRLYASQY